MLFFSSQVYFKTIFYTAQYFILTKNLNTAGNPTEIKQKLLHLIFFRQDFHHYCQVTEHQYRTV